MTDKTRKIRELNDRLRRGDASIPGKLVFTSGLLRHIEDNDRTPEEVIALVAAFDDFDDDNDPHREHDFGAFDFCGLKVFWKIDYYDETMLHGSPDPSNPAKTTRLLTVFLASEY